MSRPPPTKSRIARELRLAGRPRDVLRGARSSIYELRSLLEERIGERNTGELSIQVESFGFKHGVPYDADFVFDVRCLPNPYWDPALRPLNGQDPAVVEFLQNQPITKQMSADVLQFLRNRIPEYIEHNRNYLTVAIGCTGGQHRSVYLVDLIASKLKDEYDNVLVRHTEMRELNA